MKEPVIKKKNTFPPYLTGFPLSEMRQTANQEIKAKCSSLKKYEPFRIVQDKKRKKNFPQPVKKVPPCPPGWETKTIIFDIKKGKDRQWRDHTTKEKQNQRNPSPGEGLIKQNGNENEELLA